MSRVNDPVRLDPNGGTQAPNAGLAAAGQTPVVAGSAKKESANSLSDIMDIIKQELGTNLVMDLKAEAVGLDAFLKSIEPDVTMALASGDATSLSLVRDRIRGRLYRRSLGQVSRQGDRTLLTVLTVLRTLIRAGVAI